MNGSSSKVAGVSAKSLSSTVENGALSQNYSPATAKASSSNNNSLSISTPKVSFASLFLEKLWNTVSGASKWVATTAKNIVVQTVNDGEVCIKSGSLQDCLSTCGVSMDATSVATGATGIGLPVAAIATGVGMLCDSSNGVIYLFKGEKFMAGASAFAIIPFIGSAGKQGGKVIAKTTKEGIEMMEKAGAKGVAEEVGKNIWSSTSSLNSAENALEHWNKHGKEFSGLQNAKQYVEKAKAFLDNPPKRTLSKIRSNGDTALYDPVDNIFAIKNSNNAIKTFFKPDPSKHGYSTNLDYFNAQ